MTGLSMILCESTMNGYTMTYYNLFHNNESVSMFFNQVDVLTHLSFVNGCQPMLYWSG